MHATTARIHRFWNWWSQCRTELEAGLEAELPAPLLSDVSKQVEALHPELVWELGQGADGAYVLSLSGEGNFELRKLTEAWARESPREIQRWEFRPARPPKPEALELTLGFSEHELPLKDLCFVSELDSSRARVNLGLFHPAFSAMSDAQRTRAAFVVLDLLLGEDNVERWIGAIEPWPERPAEARPIDELAGLVAEVAASASTPRYTVAQAVSSDGRPVLSSINLTLRRLDHLFHDWHLEVAIPFLGVQPSGMPGPGELSLAQVLEDELAADMKSIGVCYGHVIQEGRLRMLFYVQDKAAAEEVVTRWASRHTDRKVQRIWCQDPEWDNFRRF
jgi:hypothetical protein